MVYFIIILAVLIIAAPIVAVLPGKRDKARMVKRRAAMDRGFRVELTVIDDPDPDPEKHRSSIGKPLERRLSVAAYRRQRPKPADQRRGVESTWSAAPYAARKRESVNDRWYWLVKPEQAEMEDFLTARLDDLPPDVVKVEEKNFFISVYWHETGEVSEVIDFVERCMAIGPVESDPEEKLLDSRGNGKG